MTYLSLKDKQVDLDEFQKYIGKDLRLYLSCTKEEANAFIYRKQLACDTYLEARRFKRPDLVYMGLTDYQKTHYKIGVMEQINYELRNGEISSDSGYNGEIGAVIHVDYLDYITMSKEAMRHFQLSGMACRKITGEGIFNFGGYYD